MKHYLFGFIMASVAATALAQSPPAGGGSAGGGAAFIKGLDKDNDGFLSKAELAGTPVEADFEKIDTNKDGKLSATELEAFSGGGAAPAGAPPAAK